MRERKIPCKYCGSKGSGTLCTNCKEKLKLIRQIKRMLTEGRVEKK